MGRQRHGWRATCDRGDAVRRPPRQRWPSRRTLPRHPGASFARTRETMNEVEIRALVVGQLRRIAPEIEVDQLDPAIDLREQTDFDSIDILNLAVAIHEATGVDIPEADYPQMVSL